MKELSIEEKAKRYDEAIKVAKETYSTQPIYKEWLEKMFPELKKSDDERIRNAIIDFFREPGRKEYILNGFSVDDIIAWLENTQKRYTWKPSEEQMNLLREVQQALLGKDCHNRFVNFMYELKQLM